MSKREEVRRIWQESFDDSPQYISMYFDRVYRDEEALLVADEEGKSASSLLLQQYRLTFHGQEMPVGYIAGAATRRRHRGKGFMSQLMPQALATARDRGDMAVALIPANDALYYFYDAFGFAKVFYVKEQRYTSLHQFVTERTYHTVDEIYGDHCWNAFDKLQHQRDCYILHSRHDFENILEDNRLDGGDMVAIGIYDTDGHLSDIMAMAWGVVRDGRLVVTDCMGLDHDSRTGALAALRALHSEMPILALSHPADSDGGHLAPRGMARIVNVEMCLQAIAAGNPKWEATLHITDPILAANTGCFEVRHGAVTRSDTISNHSRIDLDVDIQTLTSIVFSSPHIGQIMGIPSLRPMISLMLD